MTKEERKARIKLLVEEMDANEEENNMMQDELDKLYEEEDKENE